MPATKITRSKTGCFTCRKRRKKCDETRPECRNCTRNQFICEGYQPKTEWRPCKLSSGQGPGSRTAGDSDVGLQSDILFSNTDDLCLSPAAATADLPFSLVALESQHSQSLPAEGAFAAREPTSNVFDAQSMVESADITFDLEDTSQPDDSPADTAEDASPSCFGEEGAEELTVPRRQLSVLFRPLPFLIDGIQTRTERKLFHHFQHVVAVTLLLQTPKNPLVTVLIPRAVSDVSSNVLLDAIMAISASHYRAAFDKCHNSEVAAMERLQWKRHGNAVKHHIQMLGQMSRDVPLQWSSCAVPRLALTLTMVLHQFALYEGGTSASRTMHLGAAKELVRQIYQDGTYDPGRHDALDSFILNWFYFHDVCYALTSRDQPPCIDLHACTLEASGHVSPAHQLARKYMAPSQLESDFFLIGPYDGLLTILARIIKLHKAHPPQQAAGVSVEVINEGLEIEADLRDWNYNYQDSGNAAVAHCYRLSGFILLWFTMYPDSPMTSEKIQLAVMEGLRLLKSIKDTDNAQTCSLLPLFIFGVSTDIEEDREFIRNRIDCYGAWASIANIKEARRFLEDWWRAADKIGADLRRWWDWETYLKANEVDIILV